MSTLKLKPKFHFSYYRVSLSTFFSSFIFTFIGLIRLIPFLTQVSCQLQIISCTCIYLIISFARFCLFGYYFSILRRFFFNSIEQIISNFLAYIIQRFSSLFVKLVKLGAPRWASNVKDIWPRVGSHFITGKVQQGGALEQRLTVDRTSLRLSLKHVRVYLQKLHNP